MELCAVVVHNSIHRFADVRRPIHRTRERGRTNLAEIAIVVDMHARNDPPTRLLQAAAAQGGVVSSDQVRQLGFDLHSANKLVARRSWQRVTRGVYFLGVGQPGWLGYAWAGVLLGGADARLGYEAAGYGWNLLDREPTRIRVLVPHGSMLTTRDRWMFHQERPQVRSGRSPGSPPRTTIEDTVIDLCSEATPGGVTTLVTKAIQSDRTTTRRLLQSATARQRLRHRALLLDLLTEVAVGAESALELRYLNEVERPHGLPKPVRQARASFGRAFHDLRYDEFGLVVELDGRIHIQGRFRDMHRDNSALLGGAATLRYGWPDVAERPCEVAWQVAAVLTARGWQGMPTRCPRCALASDADLLAS